MGSFKSSFSKIKSCQNHLKTFQMFRLIFLTQLLGGGISIAGTVDYSQDFNQYYPQYPPPPQYYNHEQYNQQMGNPGEPPPPLHPVSPPSQQPQFQQPYPQPDERFGFGIGIPMSEGYGGMEYGATQPQNPYEGPPGPGPFSPPPYGYPDPGFQTQTGFEGLLIPNTWYGLLPWGIEGVIIVIAGIIVFAIIVIAIIGLIAWLCGVKKSIPFLKEDLKDKIEDLKGRSIFGDQWEDTFTNLTSRVIDTLENFNEISLIEDDSVKKLM